MRLSMIRAASVATVAAIALAACAGRGIVPSSPDGQTAMAPDAVSPLKLTTCATSPPQYDWIFQGACDGFTLKSTGGSFSLATYEDITVKGSIGENTAKGSVSVYIADAIDKSDIKSYKGKAFPPYKGSGTTFIYATVANQTTQVIKPVAEKGKAVLEYEITDSKGLPGNTCGAALLSSDGRWSSFPGTSPTKGDTVTIAVYEAPKGFELPPKGAPLYFAVNCWKS